MTEIWPVTVPWRARTAGYSEKPQRNVASFQPDAGVAIERRRASISADELSYVSTLMTDTQVDRLVAWYRDDLGDGVLPFTRNHPRTGDSVICKFVDTPAIVAVEGLYYRVSINLIRMP